LMKRLALATTHSGIPIEEVKVKQKVTETLANILSLTVSSEFIIINESVMIFCALDRTNATVTWSHYASGIREQFVNNSDATLKIENVKLEDSGVYFCSSGEQSRSVEIYVYEEPFIVDELVDVQLNQSMKVDLDCLVQQGTDLTFTWIASDQIKIRTELNKAHVEYVGVDPINITCIAKNPVGSAEKIFRIFPAEIMNLVVEPAASVFRAGEQVTMRCESRIEEDNLTKWIFNNRTIENVGDILTLDNLTPENSGVWKCVNGLFSSETKISVLAVPTVEIDKSLSEGRIDSELEITCKSEGNPAPNVMLEVGEFRAEGLGEVRLIIAFTRPGMVAKCTAENAIGGTERVLDLDIMPIWVDPVKSSIPSGSRLEIQCHAQGMKTWLTPVGEEVPYRAPAAFDPEDRVFNRNGTLIFKKIFNHDAGEYSCFSGDDFAKSTVSAMEFTHTPYSVARFPVPRSWYECLHVSFNIKPQYNDGVLLLITGSNNVDFLRLVLKGGVVHLDYDLGSGRGETESHQIRTKTWSSISLRRCAREATLTVNEEPYHASSRGLFRGFDHDLYGYLGNADGEQGFYGCMSDLQIDGDEIDFATLYSEEQFEL
ncbi:unnamed protein product, partial [Oikopleura dioica]